MKLFINNGLIVDPSLGATFIGSLVIEDGIVKEIVKGEIAGAESAESLPCNESAVISAIADSAVSPARIESDQSDGACQTSGLLESTVIDARGKWVVPGFIDLHVHFRDPGFEYKEDILSGCRSAAAGGFTMVCCMPNTEPTVDCTEVVRLIQRKASRGNGVKVLCVGAITKGLNGTVLADYEGMLAQKWGFSLNERGICGISEDGKTVEDESLMLTAMSKAKQLGLTVFSHAEPEGEIVKRDLLLAEKTGCKLHFCHISEKGSIELIREAKKRGLAVTAETAPHYFSLTWEDVKGDPNKKMNPPLRTETDRAAIIEALKDGTIDAIATDHAPHHKWEKNLPYNLAPNGVIGLETSFAVCYTKLVRTGILTPIELISKLSQKPAEILDSDRGCIQIGKAADLAVVDPEATYIIKQEQFSSKGVNSPFLGERVFGRVLYTIADGRVIWNNTGWKSVADEGTGG